MKDERLAMPCQWTSLGGRVQAERHGVLVPGTEGVHARGLRLARQPFSTLLSCGLACWAEDDDMSHETVAEHGRRVPD